MVGYHQSEAALPRMGKCICIHGFIVSSSSHAAACISCFLFPAAEQSLGLLLGEKQGVSVKLDSYPECTSSNVR